MICDLHYTPSGVRLRRRRRNEGRFNWLLLPGGPGLGSESLHELADTIGAPGDVWLVDMPGDGSNPPPADSDNPYSGWPRILAEAAQSLPRPVFVGHSTGGMYLLTTPALEAEISGLVLIGSAPDASWRTRYVQTVQASPLPTVDAAQTAYEADPSDARLRELAVASAPWNFEPESLEIGRAVLGRLPYNRAAVEWSAAYFDDDYACAWWPATRPVLILAGERDRIVGQAGWDAPRFNGPNVMRQTIAGGGHFPWIENPGAVRQAFAAFARQIASGTPLNEG